MTGIMGAIDAAVLFVHLASLCDLQPGEPIPMSYSGTGIESGITLAIPSISDR